jgi:hypothetical protein
MSLVASTICSHHHDFLTYQAPRINETKNYGMKPLALTLTWILLSVFTQVYSEIVQNNGKITQVISELIGADYAS